MKFEEKIKIKSKHFHYKYIDKNTFVLNKNINFENEDENNIKYIDDVEFLTIFAENNNLSSFYQVKIFNKLLDSITEAGGIYNEKMFIEYWCYKG